MFRASKVDYLQLILIGLDDFNRMNLDLVCHEYEVILLVSVAIGEVDLRFIRKVDQELFLCEGDGYLRTRERYSAFLLKHLLDDFKYCDLISYWGCSSNYLPLEAAL